MDFGSFGFDTTFNPEEVLAEGDYLLPDMTGAVLGVVGFEDKSNDAGWKAVSYEIQVLHDGKDGSLNGRSFKYPITVANPTFPDAAQWGFDELKRWAAAMGLTQLGKADDFIGRQFMANIGRKPQKNDPTRFNQTIKGVKKVETAGVAQRPAQQPAQGGFSGQQSTPNGGFGGQPQGFGNQSTPAGGFGQQPQGFAPQGFGRQ